MKRALIQFAPLLLALTITGSGQIRAQEMKPLAKEKVLLTLRGGRKGGEPSAKLTLDSAGNLYGTTVQGGGKNTNCPFTWCGTAIELTPAPNGKWKETVLRDFTLGKDGAVPTSGLIVDHSGNVYRFYRKWWPRMVLSWMRCRVRADENRLWQVEGDGTP